MEKIERNLLIAKRVPPGDKWTLIDDPTNKVHSSLTETLEAYFQMTKKPCHFRLAPLNGELYSIVTEEIAPPPPKTFNIYGE